jgi:hypothetical protein
MTFGAAGLLAALHLPCVLGALGAASGVTGLALWCGHQSAEASKSFGLDDLRMSKLPEPEARHPFSRELNNVAKQVLLSALPNFQEVIAAKTKDAGGAPVDTVFFKDDQQNISVVVCLNGAMCPCKEPQAYQLGKVSDLNGAEKFPGQHELLRILNNSR